MSKRLDGVYVEAQSTETQPAKNSKPMPNENPAFKDSIAVWHMSCLDDTAGGNSFLTISGDAEIGVELKGTDFDSSIKRGGDGYAAEFRGGYLDAGHGSKGELNLKGKEMSLCVRLIDPSGDWDTPIIAKYGSGSKMLYRLYTTQINDNMMLIFELGIDSDDRPLHVSVPMENIGEEKWHDVIIRYSGTKLQMFIDGVLVDEEWPMGAIRSANSEPCLIGAETKGGKVYSGFYGFIDHVALWDRALSDEEIISLSGGKQTVATREREILGEEKPMRQYWKPRGYNVYAGDCMPFFYDGTFHLFYLLDRRHHRSKWGYGAHQWAHATTTDLVNWKHHPIAIPITEEHEGSICTGSVLFHQGTYYAYYATRIPTYYASKMGIQGECLSFASSINGIHFTKGQPNPFAIPEPPYKKGPFRDPAIFQDKDGFFHLLITAELELPDLTARSGCLAHLISADLQEWEVREPFITAGHIGHLECPDYFFWNGWYYLLFSVHGTARYRISEEPFGPWHKPKNDSFDSPQLRVLKTAEFVGNRRIGAAFLPNNENDYGGHIVFREIIQHEDGSLGTKFPHEMIPQSDEPIQLQFGALTDRIEKDENGDIKINAKDNLETIMLSETPRDFRIRLRIVPGENASCFGICVRGSGNYCEGNEIRFDTHKHKAVIQKPDSNTLDENERSSIYFVDGLDKPFTLDAIVKNDIVDVCIDNRRTLISRIPRLGGNRVFLFAQNANVTFESIEVRPLL